MVHRTLPPLRIQLHPYVAAALGLALIALLAWSAATTSYALFHDQVLRGLAARYSASERASRNEIARLKADLQQVSSRALVERENFAGQIEMLSRRQADAERRTEALSSLGRPIDTPDVEPPEAELRLSHDTPGDAAPGNIGARYDALERRQMALMSAAQEQLGKEKEDLKQVYAALNVAPATATASPVKAGLGGLYIPFGLGRDPDPVSRDVQELEATAAETARLRTGLDRLPVRNPAPGASFSSGFGNRPDPFLGTLAFHSGLDLAVPPGTPARVTASGTVISAGWNGNYGLMVEVQHDHGYTTRYAHLSSIAVTPGQDVKQGDIVGRSGTTGRSTGPHLHYETRLNDAPLDPRKFLAAGAKLD